MTERAKNPAGLLFLLEVTMVTPQALPASDCQKSLGLIDFGAKVILSA